MKTIVYLDQNYLSNLTRARLGLKTPPNYLALWEHLLTAVQNELVVCPFSPFRRTESELLPSDREEGFQERDLYETANEIWFGVQFRGFEEVLRAQVRASLKRFLGTATDMSDLSEGFTTDPHGPCQTTDQLEPYSASFASWTRWVKEYHERVGMAQPSGDFSAQKQVEALAVVANLYVDPAVSTLRGHTDIFTFSALDFSKDLLRAYDEYTGVEDSGSKIGKFLRSKHMAQTPFIDIHASLVAEMAVSGQKRTPQGGDLEDVLAISTVLPYCDILTTDKSMKHLVCTLHLDAQYHTKVFSAAESDVRALCSSVGQLAQSSPAGPPPKPPQ